MVTVRDVEAFLAKVLAAVLLGLVELLVVHLVRSFVGGLSPA